MARVIKRGELKETVIFEHRYDLVRSPGSGYSFPCSVDGVLDTGLQTEALANIKVCEAGVSDGTILDCGIVKRLWCYYDPPIICCTCGGEVTLWNTLTNTCDTCGRDYNAGGQELAPRNQWGEETGESLSDIFSSTDPEALPGGLLLSLPQYSSR